MVNSTKKIEKQLLDLGVNPHSIFVDDERGFSISTEYDSDLIVAEYYELGYPWVNPVLEKLVKKFCMKWEWVNPGQITLVEV